MTLKPVFFSIFAAMLLLPAVQAEESPAEAALAEPAAEPPNPTEERIRAYREQFDQRAKAAEQLRQQHQAEMEEMRKESQAEMDKVLEERQAEMEELRNTRQAQMEDMRPQRPMTERQLASQKYHEQQAAYARKQWEERQALAEKRREARQKQQEARMDAYLKQREERLLSTIKEQEAMRNRAEDRHNYLVENQDDILQGMLDEQVDVASRHEELRLQAEDRRKKMAVMRTTMRDMAPEERRAYMEEHRAEFFGEQAAPQRPAGRPAPPSWVQNPMRPPVPPPAPGR